MRAYGDAENPGFARVKVPWVPAPHLEYPDAMGAIAVQDLRPPENPLSRREFLAWGAAGASAGGGAEAGRIIVAGVQVMFDRGAHGGRGLDGGEIALFRAWQEQARREFAASGIHFELHPLEGAYLRQQGYSVIPRKFLAAAMINLFVTATLGYDIDKDRTGGCSMGPRPPSRQSGGRPFYITFLGLHDARDTTLPHEYAHHFTLDTRRNTSAEGNFWADLRNDYWLWRQRHGAAIPAFRACAGAPWARFESPPALSGATGRG